MLESLVLENKDKQENINMSVPWFFAHGLRFSPGSTKGKYPFPLNSSERVDSCAPSSSLLIMTADGFLP